MITNSVFLVTDNESLAQHYKVFNPGNEIQPIEPKRKTCEWYQSAVKQPGQDWF